MTRVPHETSSLLFVKQLSFKLMSLSLVWEWTVLLGADVHLAINPLPFNDRPTAGLLFSCIPQTLTGKASYISKTAPLTSVSSTSTLEQNTTPWEPSCQSSCDDWPPPRPSPWELTASNHFTDDEDAVFQRNTLSKGPLLRDGGYSRRNRMGSKPWFLFSSDISQSTRYVTSTA